MRKNNKKDLILDAMQRLMSSSDTRTISVNDIAKEAGIAKGSIYYYFSSKNDIINAVIERSYQRVLEEGKQLAESTDKSAIEKMEIIYHACLDSSLELKRQEALMTFNEIQQSALMHQNYIRMIISNLDPILTSIINQGIKEGTVQCTHPKETAHLILILLTVTLDNTLCPVATGQAGQLMHAFTHILEKTFQMPPDALSFLKPEGN